MNGSIRVFVGLLAAFGGVGGIETSVTNLELASATLIALAGLAAMASGVKAMNKAKLAC